jgi:kynurenine formamidase
MKGPVIGALCLVLLSLEAGGQEPRKKIIDLTHPFSSRTLYWPTVEEGFKLRVDAAGVTDKGYYYSANSFCASEHGGTHIDAPVHFSRGGASVDRIPLERLVAPAVVLDVGSKTARDRDYLVSTGDFEAWEKAHGKLPDGSIVLLRTGWGRFYPDAKRYLGTDRRGPAAVAELHFPGLDPAAARWLVAYRKVASIGIDSASIDRGQSQTFESHQVLFKAGIPALENVARLEELPVQGFDVVALPMKIEGGSGGPLRIIALVAER